ncbi:MAG: glycosyltransferase family 9 protein [Ignavibacteriaceae bacterium]|jgi:heptosyltransferase-2
MEILNQKKIVVVQTAFIGDVVLTLPMLEVLAQNNLDAIIDIVTIPNTSEIFQASPFVNEVIVYDKRNTHKGFKSLISFARMLGDKGYSYIVAPHRSLRTSLLVLFSGIKESVGFNISSFPIVYKHLVDYPYELHEVARNISLVSSSTAEKYSSYLPKMQFSDDTKKKIDIFISTIAKDKNIIAIAPGSVWETKRYPVEHFISITRALINKNYLILLIGSDLEYKLNEEICKAVGENSINIAGKNSLSETIYLLSKCNLLITNDSAPTHFGMAADIPVLTIYCSTVPDFGFAPYNSKSGTISFTDLQCKPCGIHGYEVCPLSHFDCGQKLLPELVLEKIDTLL